jgi:hypothetical protein
VSTAVAIVAIVFAAFVGPSVTAWWVQRQQGKRQDFERESSDLAELRRVLDDASAACNRVMVTFHEAWAQVTADGLTGQAPDRGKLEPLVSAYSNAMLDATAAGQRVQIRLGASHPVAAALRTFNAAVMKASANVSQGHSPKGFEQAMVGMKDADAASARFVEEANRLVGSKLPE